MARVNKAGRRMIIMSSMRYLSKKLEKLKQSYVKTFQTNKVIKGIPQKLREGGSVTGCGCNTSFSLLVTNAVLA